MKKKVLAAFLTVCMAASLAACGGSSDADTSSDAAATTDDSADAAADDTADAADDTADAADDSASGDLIKVGFAQVGAESDWRTANTESMKATFTEENGYELLFDDAQQKQENQITAIRNFIQQEVDYILLAPVTATGWETVLQEAKDAGIPVILVDRQIETSDDSLYTAYIGADCLTEGRKAGEWIGQWLTAKGIDSANIVNIQGTIGSSAQIGRSQGLEEACEKYDSMNLLAQQTGEFTQAKGQEVMEAFLKQYDNINIVYCENDNEAFGAIDAIKAAGKTPGSDIANGEIMVITFDGVRAGMEMTLAGEIAVAIECNPLHGPRAQGLIEALEAGEEVEKIAYVDEGIFTPDMTVPSVTVPVGDEEVTFEVTELTQEVVDGRAY